jgi:hypothetical protein
LGRILEKQTRERLECYKQSFMGDSEGAQKTKILIVMWVVKTILMRLKMEMKTHLGIGLEDNFVIC